MLLDEADPAIEWEWEPPPPVALVDQVALVVPAVEAGLVPKLPPAWSADTLWVCDGICAVLNVVAPALKPLVVIVGVWFVKTEVNPVDPPLPAVPETTRSALLSCVVDLVQPVGAVVCANNIAVPVTSPPLDPAAPVAP
jgi:hypothetical protein